MTFDNFINQAWDDHVTDSKGVAARLEKCIALLTDNNQIPTLVNLATHVYGEHLGQWKEGVKFLNGLRSASIFQAETESNNAINRSVAALELAGGLNPKLQNFGNSDLVRIFANAAAALCGQNQIAMAIEYFKNGLEIITQGELTKEDPANRALAVTGNNLAATLEEKNSLSEDENRLMILAALTGRKFWEIAGTWLNVARAEYRLARTYLKTKQFQLALVHAQLCLEVNETNKAEPLELFLGYEVLALVENERGNLIGFSKAREQVKKYFEKITNENDKSWCQSSFDKLLKMTI